MSSALVCGLVINGHLALEMHCGLADADRQVKVKSKTRRQNPNTPPDADPVGRQTVNEK